MGSYRGVVDNSHLHVFLYCSTLKTAKKNFRIKKCFKNCFIFMGTSVLPTCKPVQNLYSIPVEARRELELALREGCKLPCGAGVKTSVFRKRNQYC